MTEKEFEEIVERLDNAKYDLLKKGISFSLKATNKAKELTQVGIGTGETVTVLALQELWGLFCNTHTPVSLEDFAESVKKNFIDFAHYQQEKL